MIKTISSLSLVIASIALYSGETSAQVCTPDSQYTQIGLWPDSVQGLDTAFQCTPYSQVLTLNVPADTTVFSITCNIVSIELTGITGLPPGLSYSCEPVSCVFPGGASGCGLIFGIPTDTGYYPLTASTTTILAGPPLCSSFSPIVQPVSGYSIMVASPLTVTKTDAGCAGLCNGSATVSQTGLTAPITYVWGDPAAQTTQTATGLCAGLYAVTVTDSSGCTSVASASISNTSVLNTSIVTTDATCGLPNGTATATTVNGTAPYTYAWSSGDSGSVTSGLIGGSYTVSVTDAAGCTDAASATVNSVAPMILTYTATFATCGNADGSVIVSVSGGTPPYNGWGGGMTDTTITGLASGSYMITITDALGCVDSINTNVSDLGGPAVSISSSTMVTCNGACDGVATVSVSGGSGPLTYSWNTSPVQTTATASSLCAGSYTVTVNDSLCTAYQNASITEPVVIVIGSETVVNPLCYGDGSDSIMVIASGGTGSLSYSVDSGLTYSASGTYTGLGGGTYYVVVMDTTGCTIQGSTVTVTEPPQVIIDAEIAEDISCYGLTDGSLAVSASGGTGTLYYSMDGGLTFSSTTGAFATLPAGNYPVAVRDGNGCEVNGSTLQVAEPPALTVSTGSTLESFGGALDGTATATTGGGTGTWTYSWNTSPVQTSEVATGLAAGAYIVTVTDANGCTVSDTVMVGIGSGISGIAGNLSIELNPNPAHAELFVKSNLSYNFTFTVLDVSGRQVLIKEMHTGTNVYSIANLSPGLYVYHLSDHSGPVLHQGKFSVY